MLKLNRWGRLMASALCIGLVGAPILRADDEQPHLDARVFSDFQGVIRVVGPDGQIQERRFGSAAPPDNTALLEKLKELQKAAGDREAVERISQELLELAQKPQADAAMLPVRMSPLAYGIGVSLAREFTDELRAQLKVEEDGGVLVQSVAEGSPADKAGLKENDVILKVDDKPITLPASLADMVQAAGTAEQPLKLVVISGGETKTISVTPAKSQDIEWKFFDADTEAGAAAADLDDILFFGRDGQPPMMNLQIPPGIMMPHMRVFGQANGMPMFGDQAQLQERVEKLEAELKELNAKLDKLVEKN